MTAGWYVASAVLPLENKLCTVAWRSLDKYQFSCTSLHFCLSMKWLVDFNHGILHSCVAEYRYELLKKNAVLKHTALPVSVEDTCNINLFFYLRWAELIFVSYLRIRRELIVKHIKDLSIIPKRSDHRVQFLTGVFFYILYMKLLNINKCDTAFIK